MGPFVAVAPPKPPVVPTRAMPVPVQPKLATPEPKLPMVPYVSTIDPIGGTPDGPPNPKAALTRGGGHGA